MISGRIHFWAVAGLSLGCLTIPLRAQNSFPPVPPSAGAPATAKSPVEQFRELLAMNVVERRQALTNRPPEIRKRILAKLREYESLKPDERELRLQVTELRWHLVPLMNLSGASRAASLARVPANVRPLVEARLARWDLLPPELQQELLGAGTASRYFAQPPSSLLPAEAVKISVERRAKLEAGIEHWRAISEEQRQKMLASFNQFFELTADEKEKTLNTISDAERKQMEKTLAAYGKLTPAQRIQCIRSFEKFVGMTLVERQQFLKNAERWKLMTPAARSEWRDLVNIAPLMPPTVNTPPVPRLRPPRRVPTVVTN
jgi:hypothetical protein